MHKLAQVIKELPDPRVEATKKMEAERLDRDIDQVTRDIEKRFRKSGTVFVISRRMRGFELCSECGKTVNMGFFTIVNPNNKAELTLYYIVLHALEEHDSFEYRGEGHSGVVEQAEIEHALGVNGA